MKAKIAVVLVSLFFGMSVGAQNVNSMNSDNFDVQLTAKNQIVVRQINSCGEKIKVFVYNSEGEKISGKTLKCNGNMKVYYDLSKVQDNEFIFSIVCNKAVVYAEQVNKLADGTLSIPEKMPKEFYNAKQTSTIYISEKQ